MLVVASNTPEQLDWAINDRLDEMIEFSGIVRTEAEKRAELKAQRKAERRIAKKLAQQYR